MNTYMHTHNYSWQWAADASDETFNKHFIQNSEKILSVLISECENDTEHALEPLINPILKHIAHLPFDAIQEKSEGICPFFKAVKDWEGDKPYRHYDQLLGIYLQANLNNQYGLMREIYPLMYPGANHNVSWLNSQTKDEKRLMVYAEGGDFRGIKRLIDGVFEPFLLDTCELHGLTPLHVACIKGHYKTVKILLESEAIEINKKDLNGCTALMLTPSNRSDIISLLKLNGATLETHNNEGADGEPNNIASDNRKVLLEKTIHMEYLPMFKQLWHPSLNPNDYLFPCLDKNLKDFFSFLKEKGADINSIFWDLCRNSDERLVSIALEWGADINMRNEKSDMTVLMHAAQYGKLDIVEMLMRYNPDLLNLQDKWKMTALMWASLTHHNAIAKHLVEKGADVNIKDISGKTAFDYAVEQSNTTLVELMNVKLIQDDGNTAFDMAVESGDMGLLLKG